MTYEETLHYLYTSIPVFQHSGASAYKPGLGTSIALDDYLGNPHKAYKTIHVAGTNGKGSVSHLLAAILRRFQGRALYLSPLSGLPGTHPGEREKDLPRLRGRFRRASSFFLRASPSFFLRADVQHGF